MLFININLNEKFLCTPLFYFQKEGKINIKFLSYFMESKQYYISFKKTKMLSTIIIKFY